MRLALHVRDARLALHVRDARSRRPNQEMRNDTFSPPLSANSQSQALPRHMRRRTASHKPRRMPVALKNSGKNGRGKKNFRSRNATSGRPFTGKGSKENLDVPSAGIPSTDEKNEDGFPDLEGGAGVVGKTAAVGKEEPMRCRKHRRRPRAMLEARSPHAESILGEESPSRCYLNSMFCSALK